MVRSEVARAVLTVCDRVMRRHPERGTSTTDITGSAFGEPGVKEGSKEQLIEYLPPVKLGTAAEMTGGD